jgi:putative transposase
MTVALQKQGHEVNRKRVQRFMQLMGLEAIYPERNTGRPLPRHKIYPYLLRNLEVTRPNQVRCANITYISMRRGFMYLVAVMDSHSRHMLSWRLSNSLDCSFCIEALASRRPKIFNSDQGAQFTANEFTQVLLVRDIAISMDGLGRALDNVFLEWFWRSYKQEDINLKEYEHVKDLSSGTGAYNEFYSQRRPHQALGYRTPYEVYHAAT